MKRALISATAADKHRREAEQARARRLQEKLNRQMGSLDKWLQEVFCKVDQAVSRGEDEVTFYFPDGTYFEVIEEVADRLHQEGYATRCSPEGWCTFGSMAGDGLWLEGQIHVMWGQAAEPSCCQKLGSKILSCFGFFGTVDKTQ